MKPSLTILLVASLNLTACTASKLTTTPVDVDGMENSVLAGELLIGSQPSVAALSQFANEGYRVIVSTRGETELQWDEKAIVDSLGMQFVKIPMPGPVAEITDEQIERFDYAMNRGNGAVVLHCASGNRASGLWAVWLVEKEGLAPQKALDLAEKTGMKSIRALVLRRLGLPPEE